MDAVTLGYGYKSPKVYIYIILVLCSRVVYKDINVSYLGESVVIPDIAGIVGIRGMLNAFFLTVDAVDLVSSCEKKLGYGPAYALCRSCN